MEDKMLMITQILKSEEEGELKLKMIAEVLEVSEHIEEKEKEEPETFEHG